MSLGESREEVIVKKEAVERPAFAGTRASDVEQVCKKIRLIGASVVSGIGGGINMDLAKASASEEEIQCMAVPTMFSTDAMATPSAAIQNKTYRSKPILACIVDVDIVKNAPWRFRASGFGDVNGKAAAVKDRELARLRGKARPSTVIVLDSGLCKSLIWRSSRG